MNVFFDRREGKKHCLKEGGGQKTKVVEEGESTKKKDREIDREYLL